MSLKNYIQGINQAHNNPNENTIDASLCPTCQMDLTFEEIQEESKKCFECTDDDLTEWAKINILPSEDAATRLRFELGEESYDIDYIKEVKESKEN